MLEMYNKLNTHVEYQYAAYFYKPVTHKSINPNFCNLKDKQHGENKIRYNYWCNIPAAVAFSLNKIVLRLFHYLMTDEINHDGRNTTR